MWDKIASFIEAFLIHVVLLAIFLISINESEKSSSSTSTSTAEIVDEKQVIAEMEFLKRKTAFKNAQQLAQQYILEKEIMEKEQIIIQQEALLADLHQQQEAEKLRLEELNQRQQAETSKLEQLKFE